MRSKTRPVDFRGVRAPPGARRTHLPYRATWTLLGAAVMVARCRPQLVNQTQSFDEQGSGEAASAIRKSDETAVANDRRYNLDFFMPQCG